MLKRIRFKLQRKGSVVFKLNQFPPGSRREASLIGFLFKLLDGDGRGELSTYTLVLDTHYPTFASRHDSKTIHIISKTVSVLETPTSNLIEVSKEDAIRMIRQHVHVNLCVKEYSYTEFKCIIIYACEDACNHRYRCTCANNLVCTYI